ncbi:hypothetical protein NPIL_495031 [Nephila pilipes]|uniref:Uncharacterized protein n=1 Tax=Nephila pilipes TaxID=299642 RepID=A0A8X6MHN8_NEPPI|nr:hypothetical protein NPIL_495031 [Nephila pilipes]
MGDWTEPVSRKTKPREKMINKMIDSIKTTMEYVIDGMEIKVAIKIQVKSGDKHTSEERTPQAGRIKSYASSFNVNISSLVDTGSQRQCFENPVTQELDPHPF